MLQLLESKYDSGTTKHAKVSVSISSGVGIGAWWALSCDNYRRIKTSGKCTQSINILVVCLLPLA